MNIGIVVLCSAVVVTVVATLSFLAISAIHEDMKYKRDIEDARKARNFMRKYQEYVNKRV